MSAGRPGGAATAVVGTVGPWKPVLLLYTALTILFTWPLGHDPAGTVLAVGPDANLFMWTLGWDVHAFLAQPLAIFDANIYYPFTNTLAYSENLIGSAVFAAPVIWATGNLALALNVVEMLSVVLCAMGTYVLARRMGLSPLAAALAGLIFAFSPARFFRTGQLHQGPVQWIPFGLAALHAYLGGGRRRDLWLACAFFSLQALTSGHGAAFITLAYALLILHHLAARRPLTLMRRVRDLGVTGLALLAPSALLYLPYRRAQTEMGLKRSLENWVVTPESFIASPAHVHQWLLAQFSGAPVAETASAFLFPGYLPLVLAAAVLLWPRRAVQTSTADTADGAPGPPVATAVVGAMLAVAGWWLALGPPVGIWPLVYDWPGLSFVRVPSRFLVVGMLGLSLLAGFGADRVFHRVRPRGRRPLALALGAWLVIEFAAFPLQVVAANVDPPAADRWLASLSGPVVVAELPLADPRNAGAFERRQTEVMLHTTAHWHKTVHGYSGIRPPFHEALYDIMRSFPDEACLDRLRDVGVTHIVVHPDWYAAGEWPSVQDRIQARRDRLELRFSSPDGRVYELR
ncbi:MAG: hypothetical protein Q7V01_07575 [Vicinamibacterales bacterium]|nr:hypothetical protein [Vicinamibacterales bacterium]